ncbi:MAG: 1,4-dihydroxy-2-naphthoate polyprenyltransferase [Calditrichaeota bacterium]|nr:MAG: 1,4-dihydroxy-2-naphthoate polyprenyltransferase [Calditrichota bacterium]
MPKAKIKAWIYALRLRTLPLATASILLGSFLAAAEGAFRWDKALLCWLTAILLQILSNLANDYGDALHGADNPRRAGPRRATQSGMISIREMRLALIVCTLLCLFTGYLLIRDESVVFYILGIAAILAAVLYTVGPRPYGYAGLGDLFVLVFFGLVGVYGSYYLQAHRWNWLVLLPAFACGFFCVAVLNINNIRDMESDKEAGKITLAIRLGKTGARLYHWFLLLGGMLLALLYVIFNYRSTWQFAFLIITPLVLKNGRAIYTQLKAAHLDPYLKQMALITLIFCLSFGIGNLL